MATLAERLKHARRHPELPPHERTRLGEIRVVRHDHGGLAVPPEGVDEHIAGEIDVGALLLRLDDLGGARSAESGLLRGIRVVDTSNWA